MLINNLSVTTNKTRVRNTVSTQSTTKCYFQCSTD